MFRNGVNNVVVIMSQPRSQGLLLPVPESERETETLENAGHMSPRIWEMTKHDIEEGAGKFSPLLLTCQPFPRCYVLSSPRFWETRDQRFPGSLPLSLSLSRSREREGEDPGNEFHHEFHYWYLVYTVISITITWDACCKPRLKSRSSETESFFLSSSFQCQE